MRRAPDFNPGIRIAKKNRDFSPIMGNFVNNVCFYIYRLLDKGLIKKVDKDKYKILDNMFKEYFLLQK